MLNAVSGVMRAIAHPRSNGPHRSPSEPSGPATAQGMNRGAIGLARSLADSLTATPRARERAVAQAQSRREDARQWSRAAARRRSRRRFVLRLTTDRALPLAIALIVVVAAGVSLAPAAAPVGAAQREAAAADEIQGVRLAIGGGAGPVEFDGPITADDPAAAGVPVDDGTLYKPVAVDTSIKSSASKLQHYTVKDGDTLTAIASRYGVSMMTVWWANELRPNEELEAGLDLVVPPVDGLVVTVKSGDTLETLAAANEIEAAEIVKVNELDDPNLIVGQVLMLPHAKGEPIPTPEPTPKPTPKPRVGSGNGGGGVAYSGGAWAWAVVGGGNYISQYFHYGHYGLDIAASYGSTIVSPLAGRVTFAGWKSNGGGYQVWISHGSGLYTTLNHMSAVTVSTGQNVSRGHRVGRVGMSGWASGSHLHVEVWVGAPWESGSYRVNPLRYY